MFHDRPILTLTQVRQWERRLTEIEALTTKLSEEATDLTRKLEAARVLMGDVTDGETKASPAGNGEGVSPDGGVPASVLRAVEALNGTAPKPADLKNWIKVNIPSAYEKLQRSPTYLYTALLRHVQMGRLVKEGDGYGLPTSSAQAETGGVAPPAQS
jgi:hypothetical protein